MQRISTLRLTGRHSICCTNVPLTTALHKLAPLLYTWKHICIVKNSNKSYKAANSQTRRVWHSGNASHIYKGCTGFLPLPERL